MVKENTVRIWIRFYKLSAGRFVNRKGSNRRTHSIEILFRRTSLKNKIVKTFK